MKSLKLIKNTPENNGVVARPQHGINGEAIAGTLLGWSVLPAIRGRNEAFFVFMVIGVTFLLTLWLARRLGSNAWNQAHGYRLLTVRAFVEATLLCAVVISLYMLARQFDSKRAEVMGFVALLSAPVYAVWIGATVKRASYERRAGIGETS